MEPLMLFTLDAQCDDGTASTLLPSLHGMHYELTKRSSIGLKTVDQCNDVYYKLAYPLDPRTSTFVARNKDTIEKLTRVVYVAKRVCNLRKVPMQVQDSEESNEDVVMQEPTKKKQRKVPVGAQVDSTSMLKNREEISLQVEIENYFTHVEILKSTDVESLKNWWSGHEDRGIAMGRPGPQIFYNNIE